MPSLGVNTAGSIAYLAVAQNNDLIDVNPNRISFPEGVKGVGGLLETEDEVDRLLATYGIESVLILEAEGNYSASYKTFSSRIRLETVIAIAAGRRAVTAEWIARATVRSILGMPRKGKFEVLADSFVPPVGTAWRGKRSLAASVALAAERTRNGAQG